MSWEELLDMREGLKRRMDRVATVHGWQGRTAQQAFLGGIEPGTLQRCKAAYTQWTESNGKHCNGADRVWSVPAALLQSIQAEIVALDPAAEALETADLLLELQAKRTQLGVLSEERDRMAEDVQQLQEEFFEAKDQVRVNTNSQSPAADRNHDYGKLLTNSY
eukprot:COSAG05_NODE_3690_length_1905_cov_1.469546_2_plen_163_part_00